MEDKTMWSVLDMLKNSSKDVNYALLVLNQPILVNPNLIQLLWSGALLRATADGGTNRWLDFIEKHSGEDLPQPDFITGDFDSITERTRNYFCEKSVPFIETPDQSETDFTKALKQINAVIHQKNLKLDHILVLCTNSGRIDHIMGNLETLHTSRTFLKNIPVILMSSNSLTWLLSKGNHVIEVPEEFVRKSFSVGLIPLCGSTIATTTGLMWNLENNRLAFGELVSTSNTFKEKLVSVKCDRDLLWTVQFTPEDS